MLTFTWIMPQISSHLLSLEDRLSQLEDIIEDYSTLSHYTDDHTDNNIVNEINSNLKYIHDSIIRLSNDINLQNNDIDIKSLNSIISKYKNLLDFLKFDKSIVISKIDFHIFQLPENLTVNKPKTEKIPIVAQLEDNSKSVRFKQNLIESSPPKLFKPYKDNIDDVLKTENGSENENIGSNYYKDSLFETINKDTSDIDNPTIDLSNKQIFIHNQQQFDFQDSQIDQLHNSVKQQHQISININDEISDQFVLLNDLENNIEASNNRLINSTNKLQRYRQALKKRGDWMCIMILIFILLFLLIIVK